MYESKYYTSAAFSTALDINGNYLFSSLCSPVVHAPYAIYLVFYCQRIRYANTIMRCYVHNILMAVPMLYSKVGPMRWKQTSYEGSESLVVDLCAGLSRSTISLPFILKFDWMHLLQIISSWKLQHCYYSQMQQQELFAVLFSTTKASYQPIIAHFSRVRLSSRYCFSSFSLHCERRAFNW